MQHHTEQHDSTETEMTCFCTACCSSTGGARSCSATPGRGPSSSRASSTSPASSRAAGCHAFKTDCDGAGKCFCIASSTSAYETASLVSSFALWVLKKQDRTMQNFAHRFVLSSLSASSDQILRFLSVRCGIQRYASTTGSPSQCSRCSWHG